MMPSFTPKVHPNGVPSDDKSWVAHHPKNLKSKGGLSRAGYYEKHTYGLLKFGRSGFFSAPANGSRGGVSEFGSSLLSRSSKEKDLEAKRITGG